MVSTILSPIQSSYQSKKTATVTERPSSPLLVSPFKRKTMSITQTYYLAHKARAKLSAEAQKPDHDLRRLVGSANLLDALMLELADAEREQESWFNQSVRGATKKSEDRRVQWADTIVEPEEDWDAGDADSDSSSDSGSEYDEDENEDVEMADAVSLTRIASATDSHKTVSTTTTITRISTMEEDEYFDDDEEEDYAQLSLTRSPSHSASSPPDLDHDSDSSEDESMPPSPPSATLRSFSEKEHQEPSASEKAFYDQGFYVPSRNPARLVSAISVY